MKGFLAILIMVLALAACNNSSKNGDGVGDSMTVDPTTAQPITTEPDTVGPGTNSDTTLNQNQ